MRMCQKAGYSLTLDAREAAYFYFKDQCGTTAFANARGVRKFFEEAIHNQANRASHLSNPSQQGLEILDISDLPDK